MLKIDNIHELNLKKNLPLLFAKVSKLPLPESLNIASLGSRVVKQKVYFFFRRNCRRGISQKEGKKKVKDLFFCLWLQD